MALLDLWNSDRSQIREKRLSQLIAFAGDGQLLDGSSTSLELRSLLAVVPSELLGKWTDECLNDRFSDFGFVLQDIVNEIGRRLGFTVDHGVYRGRSNLGHDGLWTFGDRLAIIVESKASTDYKINLTRIAKYRGHVAPRLNLAPDDVSILIIVADEDTTELEAQVRGSRYAWSVRLLGVRALLRLVRLKESLDDPAVERQIQEILLPQEFTRLDRIIDLVFATVEDAQDGDTPPVDLEAETRSEQTERDQPVSFHDEVIPKLERHFGSPLVKRSRVIWATADDATHLSCQVSKKYQRSNPHFWFGLKQSTRRQLESADQAYCAFGLGSPDRVVLLALDDLAVQLPEMYTSNNADGDVIHWHIRFEVVGNTPLLHTNGSEGNIDVTDRLL